MPADQPTTPDYIPWRDREFVTMREAAQICARSVDWIRDQLAEGTLACVQFRKGSPAVVTVASLVRFLSATKRPSSGAPGVRPRLIVDNS